MNILIVDDHPLTCQGLSALLAATQPQAQIRHAYSAQQASQALLSLPAPEWIFLDIHLSDDPEHRFFQQLCGTPWIDHVVLISAEAPVELIRTALASGARGFIPKTAEPERVIQGFQSVLAGEFYLPENLSLQLRHAPAPPDERRQLSPRLLQVQDLLCRGTPNKLIARELGISTHTVKEYVSSVLAYHGVGSRLDLVLKLGQPQAPTG